MAEIQADCNVQDHQQLIVSLSQLSILSEVMRLHFKCMVHFQVPQHTLSVATEVFWLPVQDPFQILAHVEDELQQ